MCFKCVSLPSSNIFFHSNFLLSPTGIYRQGSYKYSVDLRGLSTFIHLLSPSPIQLSHCGLEVIFSSSVLSHIKKKMYTDLFHVQVVFNTMSLYRLLHGLVLYTIWLSSRERQVVSRLLRTCKSILSLICIHSRRFY